jgi:hypothetical protein
LVYGYIRRKKNQKQKLEADLHNSRTAEQDELIESSAASNTDTAMLSSLNMSSFFDPPLEIYVRESE